MILVNNIKEESPKNLLFNYLFIYHVIFCACNNYASSCARALHAFLENISLEKRKSFRNSIKYSKDN